MDADLALVLGMLIGALSVPAAISAWNDARAPRGAALTLLAAGALVLYALSARPGGYDLADLPHVIFGVIGRFLP